MNNYIQYDCFISHSSKDVAHAIALVERLESRGMKCWIAPRDIVPGSIYAAAIVDGITASAALIVLISENSLSKPQHLEREVNIAVGQSKPVYPVKLLDIEIYGALQFYLSVSQEVRLFEKTGDPVEQLISSITRAVPNGKPGRAHRQVGMPPGQSNKPVGTATATGKRTKYILAAGVSLAVVVGSFYLWRFGIVADTSVKTGGDVSTALRSGNQQESNSRNLDVGSGSVDSDSVTDVTMAPADHPEENGYRVKPDNDQKAKLPKTELHGQQSNGLQTDAGVEKPGVAQDQVSQPRPSTHGKSSAVVDVPDSREQPEQDVTTPGTEPSMDSQPAEKPVEWQRDNTQTLDSPLAFCGYEGFVISARRSTPDALTIRNRKLRINGEGIQGFVINIKAGVKSEIFPGCFIRVDYMDNIAMPHFRFRVYQEK